MNDDRAPLLQLLPDEPRWIDTRGTLLGGRCRIVGTVHAERADCIVISDEFPFAGLVGEPPPQRLRELVERSPGLELLAQHDARPWLARVLPGWTLEGATLHTLPSEVESALARERSACANEPPQDDRPRSDTSAPRLWPPGSRPPLDHLRADLRDELQAVLRRSPVATWMENSRPVAVCAPAVETETLWDVSVETLEPYRGRDLAGRCFRLLVPVMAARGKRAVWGAHDSNAASLRVAEKLGFQEAQRIWTASRQADH